MAAEQLEACPLRYECAHPQTCSRFEIGMPGLHPETVQKIGLTARIDVIEDTDFTFIGVCEGPVSKGLNATAEDLQELLTGIDDGTPFDLVESVRRNMSLIDYINHRQATDELSHAVRSRRG